MPPKVNTESNLETWNRIKKNLLASSDSLNKREAALKAKRNEATKISHNSHKSKVLSPKPQKSHKINLLNSQNSASNGGARATDRDGIFVLEASVESSHF